MAIPIITLGREYGSGGRIIGKKVADALGIPFYDEALTDMASKETGFSKDYIRQAEQTRPSSFLYNLYTHTQSLPMTDQIFIAESQVIREIATKGSSVIVGRCADYILRDTPHALHVFIHAPLEQRIAQVRDVYKPDVPEIRPYVIKRDKARVSYYNHYTDSVWGRLQNYHLCLSSSLGFDTVTHLILEAAKKDFS